MSGSQSQEMLHRTKQKPQEEKEAAQSMGGNETDTQIEFDKNGGGGGPPRYHFESFSSSSSIQCRPDPDNPGKQICTRTEKTNHFDPFHGGHRSSERHSEESRDNPMSGFLARLMVSGGDGHYYHGNGAQQQDPSLNTTRMEESSYEKPPSMVQKVLNFFDMTGEPQQSHQRAPDGLFSSPPVPPPQSHSNNYVHEPQPQHTASYQDNYPQGYDTWEYSPPQFVPGHLHHPAAMMNPFQIMEQMEREMFGQQGGHGGVGGIQPHRRDPFFGDDGDDMFGRGFGRLSRLGQFGGLGGGFAGRDPFDEFMNRGNFGGQDHFMRGSDPRFEQRSWHFDSTAGGEAQRGDNNTTPAELSKLQQMQEDEKDRFSRRGKPHFQQQQQRQPAHQQSSQSNFPPQQQSSREDVERLFNHAATGNQNHQKTNVRLQGQIYDV